MTRIWAIFLVLISALGSPLAHSQNTYHERMQQATDRRATEAMARFHRELYRSRLEHDSSTHRLLLSLARTLPANRLVEHLDRFGIAVEAFQVAAGEEFFSFPAAADAKDQGAVAMDHQASAYISQRIDEVRRQIAQSSNPEETHWLQQSYKSLSEFQSKRASTDIANITAVACRASYQQIADLMNSNPGLIRAVEDQGASMRQMGIPLEVYDGVEE